MQVKSIISEINCQKLRQKENFTLNYLQWSSHQGRSLKKERSIISSLARSTVIRFWETATYPSTKPTLTLTSHSGQTVGLGKG